jgi:dipeptidyl aminopeptidase/acylaminoacyl peptidase
MKRIFAVGVLSILAFTLGLGAQSKPTITRADYGQWESLSAGGGRGGGGGGLSPDGRFVAYAITRTSRSNELRVLTLADGATKVAAFGAQPTFSSDSKWLAYSIGYSEAEQERLRTAQRPIQNRLGLMNLTSGETATFDGIETFSFSGDGAYLAMKRYGPAPPAAPGGAPAGGARGGRGGGAGTDAEQAVGTTLIVRHLSTQHETTFGNVAEYAWQDAEHSHLVAMTINADGKVGNGVQLFNPESTVLRVLDSSATTYADLAWRTDSADLAVMRAKTDDRHDGATETILAWTGVGGSAERLRSYDPTADTSFPASQRTVAFRRLSWSDDGKALYLGVAGWDPKSAAPARGGRTGGRGAGPSGDAANPPPATAAEDEPASVDIWHYLDTTVQPVQKLSAATDRRRNMLAVWHLESGRLIQLGKDAINERVQPIRHTNQALVAEWSKYAMDRSIGRPAADLALADVTSGARTKLIDNVNDRYAQVSPAGKYLIFLRDDHFWTMNLQTKALVNITRAVPASFIDKESDETIKQKPAFGVAGWTKDDAEVILYDKLDVWEITADGSKALRLTDGATEQVRHRYVRVGQDEEWIDLSKAYVSLFGLWSKKSGYGQLKPAGGVDKIDRLVWLDKSVGGLARAKNADVFQYIAQDYDDSPDLFVGGASLKDAKQVTTTNPFQPNYAWGRTELIEYTVGKTQKLQGSLMYPAGYEAGKKYPMIVYMYEKLSDNVHQYVAPSDRSYYNTTVFSSQGYFVLQPDIVFTPRQPGVSVVQCVTAAVTKVLAGGLVDPKRVGVVGHSWGGFDAAFLSTHTSGLLAAAVAGAPITDLVSNYGNHHWSSGIAETDHIETGQQRMEVPLYEDLPDYIANSAVFNVQTMTVPLLIEVGDADGTVFWHQGVELFNIARRARKNVVLLQYNGEDHGLRQAKNQTDYQRRILQWFGYYLKGEEPPTWITRGESFLERDAEVKRGGRSGG